MSGCVLRLWGPYRSLRDAVGDAFIPLAESHATIRARRLGKASESDDSTYLYTISEADGGQVPKQICDAEEFLSRNLPAIQRLMSQEGVSGGTLDFAWDISAESTLQYNHFPLDFISLCSEAQLEIAVSVYLIEAPADQQSGVSR